MRPDYAPGQSLIRGGVCMVSWFVRLVRPLAGLCLVIAMLIAGAVTVSAQSTIDPDLDSDGDGTMNNMDFDDDDDGYADNNDCAPFDPSRWVDCDAPSTSGEPDNDGDGIVDRVDPDDDNDGITDDQDPDPLNPDTANPDPGDSNTEPDNDGDGIADRVDPDDDNDGVMDEQDSHPFDPDRGEKPPPSIVDSQTDSDGDGIANSHDPDDDNDGVVDELDCAPFDASVSDCPDPAPDGDDPGDSTSGSTGDPVTVGDSGIRGVGGGGPVVTSLPSTGIGTAASLAPLVAAMGIAFALLALAGLRGWLHPVRVPDRRR